MSNSPQLVSAKLTLAGVPNLDEAAALFDAYRVARGEVSNLPVARHFLFERMINHESLIYLAHDSKTQQAIGFLQLYPGFSSLAMQAQWLLSDLYVVPEVRRQGIARLLVQEAMSLVRERQDWGFILDLPSNNEPAKKLFESLHFIIDPASNRFSCRI